MVQGKKMHFEISERKVLLRLFDLISVFLTLFFVGNLFDFEYFSFTAENYYWVFVLALYLTVIGTIFEMYNLQVASTEVPMVRSVILTASVTVLIFLLTPYYTPLLPKNRIQILFFFVSVLGALLVWRFIYLKLLASQRFLKKAILVCDGDQVNYFISNLEEANPHFKVAAFINTDEDLSQNNAKVEGIEISNLENFAINNSVSEIVIATQRTEGITAELHSKLIHLLERGYIISEYAQVYESFTQRIPVQYVSRDFYRYFPFSRSNQNHLYLFVVRLLEVLFSLAGIAIGLLIAPLILAGNAIGNRGKLFYTQQRVGRNGEVFEILKLRTMIKNAEANGAVFTTTNDTRITPFGKFLRKTRLDEVPQFYNVLKGDMAVIGPRPERPIFVEEIAKVMPFYETRHVIKPGLTGWAQVNYSYGDSMHDSLMKLQYDLYYIKHRSLYLDLSIMIKTMSTVLFYRGQ